MATYEIGSTTDWNTYRDYKLVLEINETSVNHKENYSEVSYSLTLYSGDNAYEAYTPYEIKFGGTVVDSGTPYFYLAKNSSKVLTAGTKTVYHDQYGYCNLALEASIKSSYNAGGGVNSYAPNPMTIEDKSLLLTKISIGCSITYNANGGENAPDKLTYVCAASGSTNLSLDVPSRTGYNFLGWSLDSNATSASYGAGQAWALKNKGDYILYAVWEIAILPIIFSGQEILNVTFNGQLVTHLIYNGTTIF